MKVSFRESFKRDLSAVREQPVVERLRQVIEAVERCRSLVEIANAKKLRGAPTYYRIRTGEYRVGVTVEGDVVYLRQVSSSQRNLQILSVELVVRSPVRSHHFARWGAKSVEGMQYMLKKGASRRGINDCA